VNLAVVFNVNCPQLLSVLAAGKQTEACGLDRSWVSGKTGSSGLISAVLLWRAPAQDELSPFLSLPVLSTYHSAMSMTESTQAGWLRLAVVATSVILPPATSFAQRPFLDVPPSGRENVRAAEGGGINVALDTTTPLPVLVKRLEGNWREVETGKAYWIGYTDDMYSIAAHGDDAIAPLIALARTTTSDHAKHGVVLTLHLLGIERQIAGRFRENFRNPRARAALLSLLADRSLQQQILLLLIRHPWPSDLPQLFVHLASDTPNGWAFGKALQRYGIRDRPVHQEIAQQVRMLECGCTYSYDQYYPTVVAALSKSLRGKLIVEPRLFEGEVAVENWRTSRKVVGQGILGGGVGSVLEHFTAGGYTSLGERFDYYVEGDVIHLCSMATARKRWLDWYEKHRGSIQADGPNPAW